MAFSDLASNQMVSFTDAASGGFVLKPGKSHITSNQMVNKAAALDLYYLDLVVLSFYDNGELIPKIDWVNPIEYFLVANNWEYENSQPSVCALTIDAGYAPLYTTNENGIVEVGDILYILIENVYQPYMGNDDDYVSYIQGGVRVWLQVDQDNGEILTKGNCLIDNDINVYKSFLGNPVGGNVDLTAIATEVVTSSVLTINYLATGSVSLNSQNLIVEIALGNTYGNSTTPLSGFSAFDDITLTLVSWAPTEDSTYNYIVIDN